MSDDNKATVKHLKSHPSHKFAFSSASLVWQSNNTYETQFVEAALMKTRAHCNLHSGDIYVDPAISNLVSKIAIPHKPKRTVSSNGHPHTSLYVSPL